MAESPPSADVGWSMSYRRFSPSAGYQLRKPPLSVGCHLDHQNLTYWKDPQKLSRRIARERLDLMEFNFEIRHIPRKANSRADALSRRPDYDQGTRDNENIIVLPESVFVRAVTITSPEKGQDEEVIKPWVDPHKLKRINDVCVTFSFALLYADTSDCILSPLPHPLTRASVLLRSYLADAIPSRCLLSCTMYI